MWGKGSDIHINVHKYIIIKHFYTNIFIVKLSIYIMFCVYKRMLLLHNGQNIRLKLSNTKILLQIKKTLYHYLHLRVVILQVIYQSYCPFGGIMHSNMFKRWRK